VGLFAVDCLADIHANISAAVLSDRRMDDENAKSYSGVEHSKCNQKASSIPLNMVYSHCKHLMRNFLLKKLLCLKN
jgi:hypothetical protein